MLEAALPCTLHPSPRVRRCTLDLFDHFGDERHVELLLERATHDPVPAVRRQAVHSLGCQRCKLIPLQRDLGSELLEIAQSDPSVQVRSEAVFALADQPSSEAIQRFLNGLVRALEATPGLDRKRRVLLHNARYALRKQARALGCPVPDSR